jgi:formylglycine-generating enzyme required for sulfatase activity
MAGNVWELTADYFDAGYYRSSPEVDPRGPTAGKAHVLRGGSFRSPAHDLRVTARSFLPDGEAQPDVGFRCAYDVGGVAQP